MFDKSDEYGDYYEEAIPRVFVYKDLVVLRLDGVDYEFPYSVWDALIEFVEEGRKGTGIQRTLGERPLPKLNWDGTLPS